MSLVRLDDHRQAAAPARPLVQHAELLALLRYEPTTGRFFRRTSGNGQRAGDLAGSVNAHGYRHVMVLKRLYKEHRLAWFYVYGVWPTLDIDHINRDRSDNRICNLREATEAQNKYNSPAQRNNFTKIKGVYLKKSTGRYHAAIRVKGRLRHLGSFDTAEAAAAEYRRVAAPVHGEFFFQGDLS